MGEVLRYFYNVVAWIDRVLYAPGALKDAFTNKLLDRLKPSDVDAVDELVPWRDTWRFHSFL
jgi:hypothetical protein